ncbi:unnamed protein product [Eruca vesicaria subsp. sativa]|uniref:Uncharacterized protein n=1 Tax=Eruca vesicaria subsp. sativa TaxID=29727 RepID=A0ABC8L0K7_ERUVS|nr:unnamed protein product [Eruca vesicaria subsp. sativa]
MIDLSMLNEKPRSVKDTQKLKWVDLSHSSKLSKKYSRDINYNSGNKICGRPWVLLRNEPMIPAKEWSRLMLLEHQKHRRFKEGTMFCIRLCFHSMCFDG